MRQVQELTPIISRLKGAIAENTTVKWMEKGCTPFIGAGLSGDVFNDVRTASLVEYLTKKGGVPPWVPKKLQVITEYLKVEPGWKIRDEVAEYIDNVTNYRNDPNPEGLDTLRQVAELPFRVYITTNYDDLIEQALKKVNKKPRRVLSGWFFDQEVVRKTKITRPDILKRLNNKEHEIFAGEDPPRFFDPLDVSALTNEMEPVVFHLHGHFIEPLSMVLTEEDYIDFLVAFSKFKKKRKSDILPPYIDMLLKQQTLLFAIGYSLRDQNFQVLLRTIKDTLEMPTEKTHDISVQIEPDASDCIQKILQNRIADALNCPSLDETACLGKAQTELARLTVEADEVIRETMSCMETQRRYLERFFLGEFSVDVSWCNAHDFVKALYGAYFLNNTGDHK